MSTNNPHNPNSTLTSCPPTMVPTLLRSGTEFSLYGNQTPPRVSNGAIPIQTPSHFTSANQCLCNGNLTNRTMLKCSTCKSCFHDECVGLKSLGDLLTPSDDGLFSLEGWVCPECIVTARLLQPGSPIFDAIATKAARIMSNTSGKSSDPPLADCSFNTSITNSAPSRDTIQPSSPSSSSTSITGSYASQTSKNIPDNGPNHAGTSNPRIIPPARTKLPPQPRLTVHCDDVKATRKSIDEALMDIPIANVRNFSSSVKLWFPNEKSQKLATLKLEESGVLKDETRISDLVMSKVTLRFVPVDLLPTDASTEDSRKFCLEKLRAKNDILKTCSDLSIVYFKRMDSDPNLATVALKLPVELKEKLLSEGRVFFHMSSVKVYHRVHIKRCPHCQGLGHYPDQCPKRLYTATCMFCAASHPTDECPVKDDSTKHQCKNCLVSSHSKPDTPVHHAGSPKCPTYKGHYDKVSKNYRLHSSLHSNTEI